MPFPGPRADQERPGAARPGPALKPLPRATQGRSGAVVSFTITTADDDLARKLEPGAPPPSARFERSEISPRGASAPA